MLVLKRSSGPFQDPNKNVQGVILVLEHQCPDCLVCFQSPLFEALSSVSKTQRMKPEKLKRDLDHTSAPLNLLVQFRDE